MAEKDLLTTRTVKLPQPGDAEALYEMKLLVMGPSNIDLDSLFTQLMAAIALRGFPVAYAKGGKMERVTPKAPVVQNAIGTTRMQLLGFTRERLSKKDQTLDVLELSATVHKNPLGAEPPAKLTKAQQDMLLKSTHTSGVYAVSYYRPCVTLRDLGLIAGDTGVRHHTTIWNATEKGKDWLRAKGLLT